MSEARLIIDRAGGISQLAQDLSVRVGREVSVSTVKAWRHRNRIPGGWYSTVLVLLREKGIDLDEVLVPIPRRLREEAA